MEASQSPVNAPHPDDTAIDADAFFGPDVPADEPTLDLPGSREIPVPARGVDLDGDLADVAPRAFKSPEEGSAVLARMAAAREAEEAARVAAVPAPGHAPDPTLQAPGSPEMIVAAAQESPPAPAPDPGAEETPALTPESGGEAGTRAPRGSGDLPRTYCVLREIELTPEVAAMLTEMAGKGGKPRRIYMALDEAVPGRNPGKVAKDQFKQHAARLGLGRPPQPPLVLHVIPGSHWERLPLSLQPRVIDDNIVIA